MLTDEEIMEIRNRAKLNSNQQIDPLPFARDVIKAVSAKAGEQGPAIHIRDNGEVEYNPEYNGSIYGDFYAHPLPAQAIPEGWRLTDYGQIKAGDVISLVMAGRRICTSAKEVLNAGTKQEEIVYNRKKNHYFITSMVLDGTSNHKDVFVIPADSLSASPKPE